MEAISKKFSPLLCPLSVFSTDLTSRMCYVNTIDHTEFHSILSLNVAWINKSERCLETLKKRYYSALEIRFWIEITSRDTWLVIFGYFLGKSYIVYLYGSYVLLIWFSAQSPILHVVGTTCYRMTQKCSKLCFKRLDRRKFV